MRASFIKSSRLSQSFQSLEIQCTVIAKNPWPFIDVHASRASEILPGIFCQYTYNISFEKIWNYWKFGIILHIQAFTWNKIFLFLRSSSKLFITSLLIVSAVGTSASEFNTFTIFRKCLFSVVVNGWSSAIIHLVRNLRKSVCVNLRIK